MKKLSLSLLACASLFWVPLTGTYAQTQPRRTKPNPITSGEGQDSPFTVVGLSPLLTFEQSAALNKTWTPEQLKQLQTIDLERKALTLREQLTQAGFTDLAVQDAIVVFYKDKETARMKLQEQWDGLQKVLRLPGMTDGQLSTRLSEFQTVTDQEKVRRETSFKDLSTKISLPQKPRLQALLLTIGIPGDETALLAHPDIANVTPFTSLYATNAPAIRLDNGLGHDKG